MPQAAFSDGYSGRDVTSNLPPVARMPQAAFSDGDSGRDVTSNLPPVARVASDLAQYVVRDEVLTAPRACDQEASLTSSGQSDVTLQNGQLQRYHHEYHLLPHSVADDCSYWPAGPDEHVLPVETLFEGKRTSPASSSSNVSSSRWRQGSDAPSDESLHDSSTSPEPPPVRRYRRMVSYSRTGLLPLFGEGPPERSSSIPIHLDQISQKPPVGGRFSWVQWKVLICISLGELLQGWCGSVLIPFFPSDAGSRGASDAVVGMMFSCFALTQLVMTPVSGKLIPIFGMPRVLYFGLFLTGVATIGFGAVGFVQDGVTFIVLSFLVRIISAVGSALYLTSSLTFIASQFPSSMNYAVGIVETMSALGTSIGPAIGGGLYELGGYGLPFYVIGGVMIVTCLVTVWIMPSITNDTGARTDLLKMTRLLVRAPENWLCMLVLLTISIDWSAPEPGVQPYAAATFGISESQMGLYFLVASGAYALVSPVWGKLSDIAVNPYIQVAVCMAGSAGSLLIMAPPTFLEPLVPTWWLLGIGMTLSEVFTAGAFIPLFSVMLNSVVAQGLEDNISTQSFVSSVWWAVYCMGSVVGPVLAGAVTQEYSFSTTMCCVSFLTAGCALLALFKAFPRKCSCFRSFKYRLLSTEDSETQRLLDGRERRASV